MKIDLPEVDWQSKDWNIAGQLKKIFEEAGEVAEAVALQDPVNTIREALDTMQTCATLIGMVEAEGHLDIDQLILEHNDKLERKGYLKEDGFTAADDDPIPYVPVDKDFNPVMTLEAAGIYDFKIDHDTRAVYVEDLSKLTEYLGIPKPKGKFIMYQGWNLVEGRIHE